MVEGKEGSNDDDDAKDGTFFILVLDGFFWIISLFVIASDYITVFCLFMLRRLLIIIYDYHDGTKDPFRLRKVQVTLLSN